MLTLFHAPYSRSSRILSLIHEMGIQDWVKIVPVNIKRQDGTGAIDPANPHPEGKSPCLVLEDGTVMTETGAIMLYLTGMFPGAGLGPQVGDASYGPYLTWLSWYNSMMEPALLCDAAGLSHPWLDATFRGPDAVAARIKAALEKGPWLLGAQFSAADILVHSPYFWYKEAMPDDPLIRDWVARCQARPAKIAAQQADTAMMAKAA
jgi:glutathione S-transferase